MSGSPLSSLPSPGAQVLTVLDEAGLRQAFEDVLDDRLAALEERISDRLDGFSAPAAGNARRPMLTAADMCAQFQCSERTIRRLEQSGEIPPSITIGGRKLWNATDVDEFVEDRLREAHRCARSRQQLRMAT